MDSARTIAYLNGRFLPLEEVAISPLDRGFLFADGVYEVIPVYQGKPFRLPQHLQRLATNLAAIRLTVTEDLGGWQRIIEALVENNGGGDQAIYLQVTRGAAARRDHAFPPSMIPTVFAMASPLRSSAEGQRSLGASAVTLEDNRWKSCNLKSIALLANVLAKQDALAANADEAILVRDGMLTEGASSNLFLVVDGEIMTPINDWRILPGITRSAVIELARSAGMSVREEDLQVTLLQQAEEIWLTSSTREIVPITSVDGKAIGGGKPGRCWETLVNLYDAAKVQG